MNAFSCVSEKCPVACSCPLLSFLSNSPSLSPQQGSPQNLAAESKPASFLLSRPNHSILLEPLPGCGGPKESLYREEVKKSMDLLNSMLEIKSSKYFVLVWGDSIMSMQKDSCA